MFADPLHVPLYDDAVPSVFFLRVPTRDRARVQPKPGRSQVTRVRVQQRPNIVRVTFAIWATFPAGSVFAFGIRVGIAHHLAQVLC